MSPARAIGGLLLDLVYPPRCAVCGEAGPAFCPACRDTIVAAERAGVPPPLAEASQVGEHSGALREAILRLKYERDLSLLAPLAELLVDEIAAQPDWRLDALVPVPLHWRRRWRRSFDQAELLARDVSRRTGLPVVRALRRARYTRAQVGLDRRERAENLRAAFALEAGAFVGGMRVALIDDVRTTGATLVAAAGPLHQAGAAAIYALTLTTEGGDARSPRDEWL